MIRFLQNSEIDKGKWDACIRDSFNGIVYAQSWYLDIVAENWHCLVEDDYERAMPLISGNKWGIHYLFQPAFTQQLGVFSKTILSEEVVHEFISSIPGRYKFAEINLNTFNKINPAHHYKIVNYRNFELDLINSYENLLRNFSNNHKRNLKKAENASLSIQHNIKPEEIIYMFRENRGKSISNLDDQDFSKFHRLVYSGIYKGLVKTRGVYSKNNELCAGAFFLQSKNKMIFLFSGLSNYGKETNAMFFLINSFIKDFSQNNITLDFEGSNDPNLARFYQGFGSVECNYPHVEFNNLFFPTAIAVKLVKWLRNL